MAQNDKPKKQECDPAAPVLVYTTFPSIEEAERVGGSLVDTGLAACINILPGMISIYRWQGARHRDNEVVAIVKTCADQAAGVTAAIRAAHSYENPAILILPVAGGSEPFLAWVAEQSRVRV